MSKGHQAPVTDPNLLEEVPKEVKAKKTLYLCMNDQDVETFRLHEGDEMLVVLVLRKPVSAKQFIIRWQGGRKLWLGQVFSIYHRIETRGAPAVAVVTEGELRLFKEGLFCDTPRGSSGADGGASRRLTDDFNSLEKILTNHLMPSSFLYAFANGSDPRHATRSHALRQLRS